jgi:hypothetical protein
MPNSNDYSFLQWSSSQYVSERNSLIPLAEDRAKQRLKEFGKAWDCRKGVDGKNFRFDYETQFFHEEMEKLWAETIKNNTLTENAETVNTSTVSENLPEINVVAK